MLAEEPAIGYEREQHLELGGRRRLGGLDRRRPAELEAGVRLDVVDGDAGVRRLDPHALRPRGEAEEPERRDDARDAAEEEARGAPRAVAAEPRRARDERAARAEAAFLPRGDGADVAAARRD